MKIVQGEDIPMERSLEYRGGTFHSRLLLEGEAGRKDNFQLTYGEMAGDFYSPRHRHNFEQLRFQFGGTLDFDRDGKLTPGMVGYFPEGAFYGPQSQDPNDHPKTVVLQFGGASGGGYLSRKEVRDGVARLRKVGEFKEGIFHRHTGDGRPAVDGYQAIWEEMHGQRMDYPKPRYDAPIFMDPTRFDWTPVPDAPNVEEKLLGVFTERRVEAGMLRLAENASHVLRGRGVYFVLRGDGRIGSTNVKLLTALYLEANETCELSTNAPMEILHYGLPDLSDMAAPVRQTLTA
jgi:hypothetical protein